MQAQAKWMNTVKAKSDQLNADDLFSKEIIIKITKAKVDETSDQPAILHYEGDAGKPFKPCKTVRRLIGHCWGWDESLYVGRRMQLYRDDSVIFAGESVGGIRIRAMSHMPERKRVSLQIAKGRRMTFSVDALPAEALAQNDHLPEFREAMTAEAKKGMEALQVFWKALPNARKAALKLHLEDCKKIAADADIAAQAADAEESEEAESDVFDGVDYGQEQEINQGE